MKKFDPTLYLVTDNKFEDLPDRVEAALKGGVTVVQYRDKRDPSIFFDDMFNRAVKIREITKKYGSAFIVNDHLGLARKTDADGIHIGQDDTPVSLVREALGDKKIVGVSVKTVDEALKAVKDGANYLGIGAIFESKTKQDIGIPTGIEPLRVITKAVSIPTVGIGGINLSNVRQIIKCGLTGVAVVSAILDSTSSEIAARDLRKIIENTHREMTLTTEGSARLLMERR